MGGGPMSWAVFFLLFLVVPSFYSQTSFTIRKPLAKLNVLNSLHLQRQFFCCWVGSFSILMMILGNHVTALFSASSPRAAMNSSKPVDSWKWCKFSKNFENSQQYLWQPAWSISYICESNQNLDWELCYIISQLPEKQTCQSCAGEVAQSV